MSLRRFGSSLGWLRSSPGRFGLVKVEFRLSLRRFGLVWVKSWEVWVGLGRVLGGLG